VELGKLIAAAQTVETGKQGQRYQETGKRTHEGKHTRQRRTAVFTGRQNQHTCGDGYPYCQAE